jgi:hypothetical protein
MKRPAFSAFFGALLLAGAAQAQWTVINLHPASADSSGATAGSGTTQAGVAFFSGIQHASAWSGSPASWVDLHPAGAFFSEALGATSGLQVGRADIFGTQRASLWNGTPDSWTDLHPGAALGVSSSGSVAYGAGGNQQVGLVSALFGASTSAFHASLWTGSASSWVDLHPAGATESIAYATDGSQQAGRVTVGSIAHAGLWRGTAASWVDLHPAAATLHSTAYGTDGGLQAGYIFVGDASHRATHASLWRGSAASWVDLNPAGSPGSVAYAAGAGMQAGYAYVSDGSTLHATLWSGTADSALDLHQFLPPGFSSSIAQGIGTDGAYVYVYGSGFNETTGRGEALMWKRAVQQVEQQVELVVTRIQHPSANAPVQVKYVIRNGSPTQTASNVQLVGAMLAGVAANQALPISFGDLQPGASTMEATLNFRGVSAGSSVLVVTVSTGQGSLAPQTLTIVVP